MGMNDHGDHLVTLPCTAHGERITRVERQSRTNTGRLITVEADHKEIIRALGRLEGRLGSDPGKPPEEQTPIQAVVDVKRLIKWASVIGTCLGVLIASAVVAYYSHGGM